MDNGDILLYLCTFFIKTYWQNKFFPAGPNEDLYDFIRNPPDVQIRNITEKASGSDL